MSVFVMAEGELCSNLLGVHVQDSRNFERSVLEAKLVSRFLERFCVFECEGVICCRKRSGAMRCPHGF